MIFQYHDGMPAKSKSGICISSGSQLPQSGIRVQSGQMPLVTDWTKTQIQCLLDQLTVHLHSLSCWTRIRILNMEPEFFKSQNRLNKKMIRSSEPTNCSSLIIFWNDGAVNDIYTQLHGWRPNIQTEILILKPRIRRERKPGNSPDYAKTRRFKCAFVLYQICA